MKKYNSFFKSLLLTTAIVSGLWSCVGEEGSQLEIVKPATGARMKFLHTIADGPGVGIYVNNRLFSGVLTVSPAAPALLTYSNNYPVNDYATLEAGSAKVEVIVPASGTAAQVTAISGTVPVEDNKYYSVFAVGSVSGANMEALVVEDKIVPADTSKAYVRFVNTVPNATLGYDLGLGTTFSAPLTNIRYKQVTEFIPIAPTPIGGAATTVATRVTGTTATITANSFTPIKRRFYTFYIRGRVGGTGAQALALSLYTNR